MKKNLLSLLFVFMSIFSFAQDMSGKWNGLLEIKTMKLRVVFNIENKDGKFLTTMDSPDQGAKGIPVESTYVFGNVVKLSMPNMAAEYFGVYNKDKNIIEGSFSQRGVAMKLDLSKNEIVVEKPKRTQVPVKPYTYISEDLVFTNTIDNISLSGTLTLPQGKGIFPVVILISGSGPQNRDEEVMGHKPFLVLADNLTREGIAVLRFDDRGVASSKGDFSKATSEDFARDVEAAINYLKTRKEIDTKHLGLMGHSEGGMIAPMIAAKSDDVKFIILLAGPGVKGRTILNLQTAKISRANGSDEASINSTIDLNNQIFDVLEKQKDNEIAGKEIKEILIKSMSEIPLDKQPKQEDIDREIDQKTKTLTSPWYRYFISCDPSIALEKVKCPVLALNGDKDLQVPSIENLAAIKLALDKAGNKKVTIVELKDKNHLFQTSLTGNISEYSTIEETFSPEVMTIISTFIKTTLND